MIQQQSNKKCYKKPEVLNFVASPKTFYEAGNMPHTFATIFLKQKCQWSFCIFSPRRLLGSIDDQLLPKWVIAIKLDDFTFINACF